MAIADERKYLDALRTARLAIIMGGVSSYSVPGRSVTKLSLSQINDEIARTESRIASMSGGLVSYADLTRDSVEDGQ